jgi:hypothetical protein
VGGRRVINIATLRFSRIQIPWDCDLNVVTIPPVDSYYSVSFTSQITNWKKIKMKYAQLGYEVVYSNPPPWKPGFWKSFPLVGMLALWGAVFCSAAIVAVLLMSDAQPVDQFAHWNYYSKSLDIQASTLLAALSTLTNLLIAVAFSEALNVTWWLKAIHGTTLRDLHYSWSYGQSLINVLGSGRNFNKVAFAALLTSVVVIDGPLLQRATIVRSQLHSITKTLLLPISPGPFVNGGTGLMASLTGGATNSTGLYTPTFLSILQDYNSGADIVVSKSGCGGLCNTQVVAAGFDMNCTRGFIPVNLPYNVNYTWDSMWNSIPTSANVSASDPVVFSIDVEQVTLEGSRYSTHGINVTAVYKGEPGRATGFLSHTCLLYENIGTYNLQMTNDTITSLPLPSENVTEKLIIRGQEVAGGENLSGSTIGGLWLALYTRFSCSATARQSLYGYAYTFNSSKGAPVYPQYVNKTNDHELATENMTFTDPMNDILNMVHELSFRFVLKSTALNLTDTHGAYAQLHTAGYRVGYNGIIGLNQTVQATQITTGNVYATQRAYMIAAVTLILITCATIFPVFLGWWKLGRSFSQSPLEIAKAFNAPLITYANSNKDANGLIHAVGDIKVQYGVIDCPITDIDLPQTSRSGSTEPTKTLSIYTRPLLRSVSGTSLPRGISVSEQPRNSRITNSADEREMRRLSNNTDEVGEYRDIPTAEDTIIVDGNNADSNSTHESNVLQPLGTTYGSHLEFMDSCAARIPQTNETFF